MNMCHYEKGSHNDIAFVFSCPGAKEESAKKPAAGQTGTNLEQLLAILSMKCGEKLKWSRGDITITNSWSQVEYKGLTGRTEATAKEVVSTGNLARLEQELKDIRVAIICSGDRAIKAVTQLKNNEKLHPNVNVIQTRHLGFQSINQIKTDIDNTPIYSVDEEKKRGNKNPKEQIGKDNTFKRLEVVANEILEHLS